MFNITVFRFVFWNMSKKNQNVYVSRAIFNIQSNYFSLMTQVIKDLFIKYLTIFRKLNIYKDIMERHEVEANSNKY
jgi:hypothetical protein